MKTAQLPSSNLHCIHLAFEWDKLERLLREGKLHAADFNCLDQASKKSVWRILLSVAANKLRRK